MLGRNLHDKFRHWCNRFKDFQFKDRMVDTTRQFQFAIWGFPLSGLTGGIFLNTQRRFCLEAALMASTVFDLVFEVGGAKGAVFIGALEILEPHDFSPSLLVGTSAGAITASMFAAGYQAKDMVAIARERTAEGLPRISSFLDPPTTFSDPTIAGSDAADVLRGVRLVELLAATFQPSRVF